MSFFSWLRSGTSIRSPRGRAQPRRAAPRFQPRLEALEDRWLPSQIGLTVTTLADSGAGSLRDAIQTADAGSHSDKFTIGFAVTGTIDLQSELPGLNNNIAIQGPGPSSLTVEQAPGISFPFNNWPIFDVGGRTVSVSGLTIANSLSGIVNDGPLTVTNCAILNNHAPAPYGGGGIYNLSGTLTVIGSSISGNSAEAGGGIYVLYGTVTVSESTISGNSAASGGGIDNAFGTVTVTGSTISGNFLTSDPAFIPNGKGGGVFNGGMLTVSGSSLAGNSAVLGGGIYNAGTLTVANGSTLTGNSGAYGGGLYNQAGASATVRDTVFTADSGTEGGGIYNLGTATLQQCTLSGNTAGSDGGAIFNGASGTLAVKDSTVLDNVALLGADIFNLGALTLDDSTIGVIGP